MRTELANEFGDNYDLSEDTSSNEWIIKVDDIERLRVNKGKITSGGKTKISTGDYVNYDPTRGVTDKNKLTYVSPLGTGQSHGNGYGTQTYEATSEIKWKVLNISDNKVELISEEPIMKKENTDDGCFVIKGAVGYLYADQELNEICKIYGYGYGADSDAGGSFTTGGPGDSLITGKISSTGGRSISIEDINKFADLSTEEDLVEAFSNGAWGYGYEGYPAKAPYYVTMKYESGISPIKWSGGRKTTIYSYNKSRISDSSIQSVIFNSEYWLASRCIWCLNGAIWYYGRCVDVDGCKYAKLAEANTSGCTEMQQAKMIRPIVSIKMENIGLWDGNAWGVN